MSVSVAEIASALRRDADALARLLLPNGHYASPTEYTCRASLSPVGEAISVHVGSGPKQGICGFWNNAKRGGDMLDLIELVEGLDRKGAVDWAKDYLGVKDEFRSARTSQIRRPAHQLQRPDEAKVRRDDSGAERRARASHIWNTSAAIFGPGLVYLESRSLASDRIDLFAGGELRFHHGLPHPTGNVFPALVARVSDIRGKGCGIWRIFLKPDGSGKAPVETPKLGLGEVSGGAVRFGGLWTHIGVAEGIETALACRILCSDSKFLIPIWASLSTSGMRGLAIPDGVQQIRIFADHDPPVIRGGMLKESPGLSAAEALKERAEAKGIKATIEYPPLGQDWLDVLNAQTKEK